MVELHKQGGNDRTPKRLACFYITLPVTVGLCMFRFFVYMSSCLLAAMFVCRCGGILCVNAFVCVCGGRCVFMYVRKCSIYVCMYSMYACMCPCAYALMRIYRVVQCPGSVICNVSRGICFQSCRLAFLFLSVVATTPTFVGCFALCFIAQLSDVLMILPVLVFCVEAFLSWQPFCVAVLTPTCCCHLRNPVVFQGGPPMVRRVSCFILLSSVWGCNTASPRKAKYLFMLSLPFPEKACTLNSQTRNPKSYILNPLFSWAGGKNILNPKLSNPKS